MATVNETLELYEKALDIRTSVEPRQEDVLTQLNNFVNSGYTSPTAASTLEKIKKERQAYRDEFQTPHNNAQKAAGDAFDTLSTSQKTQVNATSTLRLYNDIGRRLSSNNATIDQLLIKADELLAKQKTQNASTTNANVNTQTPAPNSPGDPQNPKQLEGSADEDNGKQQENPAGSNGGPPSAPTSSTDGDSGTTSGSDKSNASADTESGETNATSPGKRLKNPLGYFSSYNYQISLYMITPDAYNAFIASGRKQIDALATAGGTPEEAARAGQAGAYLVAQSGGINNTNTARAPGFVFDYGIDNLVITTATNGKATETSSNVTEIKFQITEPYGFSFITKLTQAANALGEYAKSMGQGWPENPNKQFFILGVRFLGYDEAGNRLTGQEVYDGVQLDPNGNPSGLFTTYYDIVITELKFKIDGKATVYNIKAASLPPQKAFSIKKGVITSNKEVTAATVDEAITQLFDKLNQDQIKLKEDGKINEVSEYRVRYLGEPAREIAEAELVTPEDIDKFKWPGAGAKTTTQSTAAAEVKSQPDNTKRSITFSGSPATPILQAINNIIAQSSYLRDALKVVYTTSLEPDPKKKSAKESKPDTKKTIKWYNCSAEISNARWDSKINDWAYTITYVLQTYETPIIDSSYANPGKRYYGPHKRYEYWYTGKNSEVLQYEQTLDNSYFNVSFGGNQPGSTGGDAATGGNDAGTANTADNGGNASKGDATISVAPNQFTNQPRIGKLGAGLEAQNNYLTTLYDPGAYASAKITILGDPDFLVQDSASGENQIYSRFYGTNGFTVNPNGGQVFIEIDFKEAVDYTSNTGTLNINESIYFYKYPPNISKQIKGVSYMVIQVTSTFANGKFTQLLECNINAFADPSTSQTGDARESDSAQTPSSTSSGGPAPSNSQTTTQGTGLKKDNPSNQTQTATPTQNPAPTPQPNTTPTGSGAQPVADDDGG